MQKGDRVRAVADGSLGPEGCIVKGPYGSDDLCDVYFGTDWAAVPKPVVRTFPARNLRHV